MQSDPYIGKKIGQFEIRALLGQGGMAIVYRASQINMDRDVAIKIVSRLLTQDPFFRQRFEQEASIVIKLEHRSIVPIYDYGTTDDGITYLAMRYINDGSLAERMQQAPISLMQANRWLAQIADGLDYAHGQGVIHRDLKPGNILLDTQHDVYLVDFGLARVTNLSADERVGSAPIKPTALMGTPTYMSPEQIQQKLLTPSSDLYSLGVILYEITVGRPPFENASSFELMKMHVNTPAPSPRSFRPDLPPAIEKVLLKAIEKNPAARFQNAREMAEAYNSAIGNISTAFEPVAHPALSLNPGRIWRSRLPMLVILAAVALIATSGMLLIRQPGIGFPAATAPPTATRTPLPRPPSGSPDDLNPSDSDKAHIVEAFNGSFIGMVACNLDSDYHASYAAAVKTVASAFGLTVQIGDSANDKSRQPALIHDFIAKGAKAIVLCPLDQDAVKVALDDAAAAGIFVVENGDATPPNGMNITIPAAALGKTAGDFAAKMINATMGGKANVAILDYPDLPVVVVRAQAMRDALLAGAPNVTIVGNWKGGTTADGEASMQKAFADHPEINFILSINDAGSFGAVNVLQALKKGYNEVGIVSIDAENQARNMIRDGQYFLGSVETSPTLLGKIAVNAIVKQLVTGGDPMTVTLPLHVVTKDDPGTP
jgi:serine/threonine protein kinase/DNA-binding LacI/PurR family transcriptional regulator